MRKLVLFSAVLLSSSIVHAINLEEALTSGYTHDEELKIIKSDFLNEIEEFPSSLADFIPKVSAGLDATNNKTKTTDHLTTTDFVSNDNSVYTQNINLRQDIFNGGSSVAGLKAAQSSFRASRGAYYAKEQKIFLDEINIYLNCVTALEKYNISKTSVKSNKTQLEAMREKFKLGESTETEVASAETGLATAEANQSLAFADFETAKAEFTRVFFLDATDVEMPKIAENLPETLDEFVRIALISNPNILSAEHTTRAAKAQEYIPKGALLPRVALNVRRGNTFYNPENIATSNLNNNSTSSTLSVTIPILEKGGAEYSDVRRAKHKTRKYVAQLDNQIKQVQAQCKGDWEAFNAAKNRIEATSQGVNSAEVAYAGILQEEMLGSKTVLDVLNSEDRLNNAKQLNVDAHRELVFRSYRIKSLMGELTAEKMNLPVEYFNPDKEFKKIKVRIVGF